MLLIKAITQLNQNNNRCTVSVPRPKHLGRSEIIFIKNDSYLKQF